MSEKWTLDNSPAGKRPLWQPVVQDERQLKLLDGLDWEPNQLDLLEVEDADL